jgi:hypothetical protein
LLLKEQEEPPEAASSQGEIEMMKASSDLVQKPLSELAQQIVHVIEACNNEKTSSKRNLIPEKTES